MVGEPEEPGADADADRPANRSERRARSRAQRARAQAEQLRWRADQTVKELEARRPANRWIDAAFSTFERDVTSGGGVLAAALAFRVFIFLVPFVFVIVTAFPFLGDATDRTPHDLAADFGMTGLVATAIKSADNASTLNRLWILLGGLFALVLASRSLVRVLRITHGLAWHTRVPRLRRPTLAALVLIAAVLGSVLFGAFSSRVHGELGVLGFLPTVFVSGAVLVAVWTFVQYHLPHADVPWTKLVPGSVLVAVGVEGLQLVTVIWFARYLESKSATYGAIGAAIAILLWAYFLGRIVVSGAMLNAALYEQEQRRGPASPPGTDPSAPPGP